MDSAGRVFASGCPVRSRIDPRRAWTSIDFLLLLLGQPQQLVVVDHLQPDQSPENDRRPTPTVTHSSH